MGKKGKWLSSLKKAFTPESKEKKTQKSKEKVLGKQVDLGSNDSDAATLETLKLSPPPQPQEVKLIEAEVEPSEQTYPVEVAIAAAAAVALAAPAEAVADVVRRQSNTGPRFAGKSNEEVAAIKIQTAFRVYLAKRALHALRGLVRLKSMMEGPIVKRQAAGTLRCMQKLSRVHCQIRLRRIRMTEENQALQRQLLQKHAKEIVNLQMGEDWDDSLQSKEQIEASLLSKHEASMRREKAMAYSFTHQQTWKNASRSMNALFMDLNNPSWGWSWLERWMAARPWEGRGMAEKEQNNDQSSVKSGRSSFGGDISKAYARYQLNLDKQSLKASQKPSRTSSLQSPSTPKPVSMPTRKLKSPSPRSSVVAPDDDMRSTVSVLSERNRRHTIGGSSVLDDESLASSSSLPSYMVPTQSARLKTRLQSPLGLEANGTTPEKGPIPSTKKRLSYPPSPARPRRHSGPPKVDSGSDTNTEVAAVNGDGN
ncbi:protein IQ-DOMAIN 2-like [Gossypium arboreum]|uniref:protein IQ-DOMAIN 2-like n=1 Tax=Gossypium arboreum TaxID=29729 RepID=UPI0008192120|nr:protein IQ-DOMAIN 2-like [Gossypium arboreum]XP_017609826.1 protein IQ-DOMAIN 2-like [Gossypium arboreum]